VPRLTTVKCFLRLDPRRLGGRLAEAATIKGAAQLGEPVTPDDLGRIDLIVAGSVAVTRRGARVGKGGGYSDLEFALAREVGAIGDHTPVVTTVHDLQVLDERIPMTAHDVPLDIIATPTRVIRTRHRLARPHGIRWEELSVAQLRAMPAVASRRPPAPAAPASSGGPARGRRASSSSRRARARRT
jgi:5-formyltetrahydrofolate cyclo-ligase